MKLTRSKVSLPQVRAYHLTKHHLLDRDGSDVLSVADDIIGLHATSNMTPYLSLFNRIQGFSPVDLNREVYQEKSLVRIRAMRGTFFLFTKHLLPTVTKAIEFSPQRIDKSLKHGGVSRLEFQRTSDLILDQLSTGPKTLAEIKRNSSPKHSRILRWRRGWRVTRRTSIGLVLQLLLLERRVQSLPEEVDWDGIDWDGYGTRTFTRIRRVTYSLSPKLNSDHSSAEEAKQKLAERYVKQYGPVTRDDVAWWMDESKPVVSRVLEGMSDRLDTIKVEGLEVEFVMIADDYASIEKAVTRGSMVRFLPYEDPYCKGSKLRHDIISRRLVKRVYDMGNALPSVIVDGEIVGTWSVVVDGERRRVDVRLLMPLGREVTMLVEEEGQRLGRFLFGERSVEISLRGP